MKFTDYFPFIVVINLERRCDRKLECIAEFEAAGIRPGQYQFWKAYENAATPQSSGTHTHRDILRHIAKAKIPRALILEDDFAAITVDILRAAGHIHGRKVLDAHCSVLNGYGSFVERFEWMLPNLPTECDFLYLGGGYGEPPVKRFSQNAIQCRMMKGTHAYGVTSESAAKWTAWIDAKTGGDIDSNCGAADDMITQASHDGFLFYCVEPRLLYQRPSFSNLTCRNEDYLDSMTNPHHVQALDGEKLD